MNGTPKKELMRRYDLLPEGLKSALLSDKNTDVVWSIGEANHLDEDKIRDVAMIVSAVVMGMIHPDDLAKKLQDELGLHMNIAAAISEEISKKILAPILPDINRIYHYGIEEESAREAEPETQVEGELLQPAFREKVHSSTDRETPVPAVEPQIQSAPPQVEQQIPEAQAPQAAPPPAQTPTPVAPQDAIPQVEQPIQPTPPETEIPTMQVEAPFILHKEEDVAEAVNKDFAGDVARPQYFTADEAPQYQAPAPEARLEIGQEEVKKEREVGKTKKEQVRVVNYTGPQVEASPFERREFIENSGDNASGEDISPNNVVDLKDLPK